LIAVVTGASRGAGRGIAIALGAAGATAAYYAAPLLITNGHGLIVNTGYYGAVSYHYGPACSVQQSRAYTALLPISAID
jgi:NAD(P)-dependent dehydrogenase (short-subunit alcohol dehydrogenase family)